MIANRAPRPRRGIIARILRIERIPPLALVLGLVTGPSDGCHGSKPPPLAGGAIATTATNAVTAGDCSTPPLGRVTAYLLGPDENGIHQFTGTVVQLPPANAGGAGKWVVREGGGAEHIIMVEVPRVVLPLKMGESYAFEVQNIGRFPAASALLVSDSKGLRCAAVADIGPGELVLHGGLPGFDVALLPATCDSRPHDECYESIRNAPLTVTRAGQTVRLMHGDAADLGDYRLTCLTAQRVTLREGAPCGDAGLIAISYVIVRRDAQ